MRKLPRILLCVFLSICLLLSICGCSFSEAIPGIEAQVTFIVDSQYMKVSVPLGEVVSPLRAPRKENHIFSGWYVDENHQQEYDFSTPVFQDMKLYAGFVMDGAALTNRITIDIMPALVTVENEYVTATGRFMLAQGSGFIYKIENGIAYVLTNCHVAYAEAVKQSFIIQDYHGIEHTATLYQKTPLSAPALSADYDLAILTFPYKKDELKTIPFAHSVVREGDGVISLGSPGHQSHAITFGKMLDFIPVELPESDPKESNVKFEIIYHSASIMNGSSGGPLLNGDLELIGVNFAGTPPEEGEHFGSGCAVPLAKVQEFLSLYE